MEFPVDFYSWIEFFIIVTVCWYFQPYYLSVDMFLRDNPIVFLLCVFIASIYALRKTVFNQDEPL
jgi:hypothetical protein